MAHYISVLYSRFGDVRAAKTLPGSHSSTRGGTGPPASLSPSPSSVSRQHLLLPSVCLGHSDAHSSRGQEDQEVQQAAHLHPSRAWAGLPEDAGEGPPAEQAQRLKRQTDTHRHYFSREQQPCAALWLFKYSVVSMASMSAGTRSVHFKPGLRI